MRQKGHLCNRLSLWSIGVVYLSELWFSHLYLRFILESFLLPFSSNVLWLGSNLFTRCTNWNTNAFCWSVLSKQEAVECSISYSTSILGHKLTESWALKRPKWNSHFILEQMPVCDLDNSFKFLFNNLNATEHCLLTPQSGIHLMNFILLLPKSHRNLPPRQEILFYWSTRSLGTRILQALQMILTWEKGENYRQRAVIFKQVNQSPRGIVKTQIAGCCTQFDSIGLGWSPRIYFSNKFPSDTNAFTQRPHFESCGQWEISLTVAPEVLNYILILSLPPM